jgi:uncharacterized protein with NAD-binding domain and iron-sulfur cluster
MVNVSQSGSPLSRRRFLGGAAALGSSAALGLTAPARADTVGRPRRRVAVLGGGVAGLTVAHELVERGFEVTVYEAASRAGLGGKARSIDVAGTVVGRRRPLPAEHGFRFFPGFYQNLPDTMGRIPFGTNPQGVLDNLVEAQLTNFSRGGGRHDVMFPTGLYSDTFDTPQAFLDAFTESLQGGVEQSARVPPDEMAFFARQLAIFLTSSEARRYGQWEYTSWWDYIGAERFSPEYRRFWAEGLTRNLVAAKARQASTRTIGRIAEAFVWSSFRREGSGAPDRLLNAPTNEAFLDPWIALLRRRGVRFALGRRVVGLELRHGRVAAARLVTASGTEQAEAEWFVVALPAEVARTLWDGEVRAADPRLRRMDRLVTDWMNGIQFFLDRPTPVVKGHVSYVDSPWALTSVSQAQFWKGRDLGRDYGDGRVRDILSIDISSFSDPGMVFGKPAWNLRGPQIAHEVFAQIKAHLNDTGQERLRDDMVVRWFLDPAISWPGGATGRGGRIAANREPLLINTIGSWDDRSGPATAIPNLFLAGDHVRTDIDLATMEGANESARRAVNALLHAAKASADGVRVYELLKPPELEGLKRIDEQRFRARQPHVLDTPWPR